MAFGAGAITSRLLLDFSNWAASCAQVGSLMGGFPRMVKSLMSEPLEAMADIAREAMHAISEAVEGVVASVHQVSVEAGRAGVSTGFLKQIGAAAKTVDVDISEVAHSLAFLGRNAADAAEAAEKSAEKIRKAYSKGFKEGKAAEDETELQGAAKTFADLGIAVTDAGGKIKSTETLFVEVANAIKALPTAAQQTKAAMDLLSRGGIDMVPILRKGSDGIKEMAAEMKRLSGGAPEGLEENSEKFHEAELKISAAMGGIKKAIAAPVIGVFAENADAIVEAAASIAKTLRESFGGAVEALSPILGGFFKGLAGLAEFVGAVVTPAFKALQPVLEAIGKILGGTFEIIGKILSGIGSVIKGVTDAIGLTDSTKTSSSGGGASGKGTPTIGAVNVNLEGVNVNEASSAIAAKIAPPMRAAIQKQQTNFESKTATAFTMRSL